MLTHAHAVSHISVNHPQHRMQDPWSSSSLCSCHHLIAMWATVHRVNLTKECAIVLAVDRQTGESWSACSMWQYPPLSVTPLPAPPALRCGGTWGRVQAGALSRGLQVLRSVAPPASPAQLPASTGCS